MAPHLTRHFHRCHRSERPPHARAPHAGRMTCSGRSPGLRVTILPRLPGRCPNSPVASRRRTNRLQLRAQLRIWPPSRLRKPYRIPSADRSDQHPKRRHSKPSRLYCQWLRPHHRGVDARAPSGTTVISSKGPAAAAAPPGLTIRMISDVDATFPILPAIRAGLILPKTAIGKIALIADCVGDKHARESNTWPRFRFAASFLDRGPVAHRARFGQKFVFGRTSPHAHRCGQRAGSTCGSWSVRAGIEGGKAEPSTDAVEHRARRKQV
jgi:hypothetical protein